MVDNVDHNVCTLNGLKKFHGMGIIATIMPKVNSSIVVPKKIVSMDSFNSNWTNWDTMEEIRKHWIKQNSFETGCVSSLGSIGHFMSSTGLCEVLETIYGSDTVPHRLSGSSISRAFLGHLVSGVLYATMISDVYECPLQDQFSAEESEKDLFSNKLPESKLHKLSQVFGHHLYARLAHI